MWLFILLLMVACATPSFQGADCLRYRYDDWNILACDDESVDRHCHKWAKTWDNGEPIDSRRIRACFRGRNIIMGRSYMGCLPHEICHAKGNMPNYCETLYPCVEDVR